MMGEKNTFQFGAAHACIYYFKYDCDVLFVWIAPQPTENPLRDLITRRAVKNPHTQHNVRITITII